jgi:RNA recognition motif-containing protein
MSTYTVHVSGLAPSTTEAELHNFFTFCGKITHIDFHEDGKPKFAVVHFEKPSAAKTAVMLNGGILDGVPLTVESEVEHKDEDGEDHTTPIEQTDKPRAGIAAEYLSRGYKLSDAVLQRAIEIDNKQGISKRFLNYITSLDSSIGARALGPDRTISGKVQSTFSSATQQARSVDEQKGFSKTANDFYTKAFSSPFGQKVREFYTSTSKQIVDIHEEARRMAAEHRTPPAASAPASTPPAAASTGSESEKVHQPPV